MDVNRKKWNEKELIKTSSCTDKVFIFPWIFPPFLN